MCQQDWLFDKISGSSWLDTKVWNAFSFSLFFLLPYNNKKYVINGKKENLFPKELESFAFKCIKLLTSIVCLFVCILFYKCMCLSIIKVFLFKLLFVVVCMLSVDKTTLNALKIVISDNKLI